MMTKYQRTASMLLVLVMIVSCESKPLLKPFSSDGCSLFPDSNNITQVDWCSCCFEHDIAYWRGGTQSQRLAADQQLQQCVTAKTHNSTLVKVMYEGVRFGGSPYFHTWYRWGYGWSEDRGYQALTSEESAQADFLLQPSLLSELGATCKH